jgi:hypothetical protein
MVLESQASHASTTDVGTSHGQSICNAGLQMYKLVSKKAVAKILQNHSSAEDTDFLIQESEQIQKLVREYIRYAQKKLHK